MMKLFCVFIRHILKYKETLFGGTVAHNIITIHTCSMQATRPEMENFRCWPPRKGKRSAAFLKINFTIDWAKI